jgi:hypothetical protein
MPSPTEDAFARVALALALDEDDDVTVTPDSLLVKGRTFARLAGDGLAVDLPEHRAADLLERGIATAGHGTADARGRWVVVEDLDTWQELASEAHQFVGEPPVGRDS